MKYRTLKYMLAAGALCALTTGCSDYLDTESPSQQTSQVIYENEGMARAAIMGVYSDLAGTYVYGQKMSVNWQGVSDIELASGYNNDPSKELTSDTGAANFYSDWYNHTIQWQYIFKMAERASTAVEGIRNSEAFKSGNKAMQRYLGEALVLRSLSYFEATFLIRREHRPATCRTFMPARPTAMKSIHIWYATCRRPSTICHGWVKYPTTTASALPKALPKVYWHVSHCLQVVGVYATVTSFPTIRM